MNRTYIFTLARNCMIASMPWLPLTTAAKAQASLPRITQLFSFTCDGSSCPDGQFPDGSLVQASDGSFYGTTNGGGSPIGSEGTVFKITGSGQFTLLFSFAPGANGNFPDGKQPTGNLVEGDDGLLYGTTASGGLHNAGVAFKITKAGSINILHSFCSLSGCADGSSPGPLALGNDGAFYGSTVSGGSANNGIIFRITAAGSFVILHSLNSARDSSAPHSLLQASDGNFYATTGIGNTGDLGTVFRVTQSGQFMTLHNFTTPPDADPLGPLIQASNGDLYGATFYGEVFQSSLSGEFQVIVPGTFETIANGLIQASDGNLWSTHTSSNIGDVFAITTDGAEIERIPLDCATSGGDPQGVIQGADGRLYGAASTCVDSNGNQRFGTIFAIAAGLSAPEVTVRSFTPVSGNPGSRVRVAGDHFIGATEVTIGGVKASFQVLNGTSISAIVPEGAISGPITVTNARGAGRSEENFRVQ